MTDWFERVPKVELHLHLEGAIPHDALWELIVKYGGDPTVPDKAALSRQFEYRDFLHFLGIWVWKNQFLREYEDFRFIAEAVARDLAAQHIRYAEVFFSPAGFVQFGLQVPRIAEAIRAGLDRVPEIEVALIADLVRNLGPQEAEATLNAVGETHGLGVIGIGLGGAEKEFPPDLFQAVYTRARAIGLHTTAHAGEAAGAASIWGALRALGVERIGHGTRACEDEALLDYLVEHGIPLEMCPISNVKTRVVESFECHPVRRYFERGIRVTINSDDPKMFGNSLAEEYRALHDRLAFSRVEIRELILQGIRSSWLPENRKQEMAQAFCADPAWQE